MIYPSTSGQQVCQETGDNRDEDVLMDMWAHKERKYIRNDVIRNRLEM